MLLFFILIYCCLQKRKEGTNWGKKRVGKKLGEIEQVDRVWPIATINLM